MSLSFKTARNKAAEWLLPFLVFLALVAGGVYIANSSTGTSLKAQCVATNITRAQDNASHVADYNVFDFIYKRFLTPTKTETAQQKQVTEQFAAKLNASIQDKTWTALVNCNDSNAYKKIEIFSIGSTPPPWYATDLANATQDDPVGSVP